jgi:16S rRNA (guanine527-N7)-methyltransferase
MFSFELEAVLPPDLPHRKRVLSASARHLALLAEINEVMNLTRITTARDAAIKHILDSVLPWKLFAGAESVPDAGTGAGFPGVPLALTLPEVRFALAESTQKKARFVESVIADQNIMNARVLPERIEDVGRRERYEIVTARAIRADAESSETAGAAAKKRHESAPLQRPGRGGGDCRSEP